ncbi:hypothetical protein [Barrientosiimonas endolithica]|uniref:HEAT repeat domain-containing protein n=1 Tax=Barrientosiimonas endolithica TaxID=1535208 RepID=A0ABM8HFP0_9MICO|nr:hypothetical protein [Barrientosiimonas endolithica]BDZ59848.1 hypothetical protein GCM10025872_35050 [Barrientosiimonas endolithica]
MDAEDDTKFDEATVNSRIRTAWLLRSRRLASDFGDEPDRSWIAALRDPAIRSTPTLTRAETGTGRVGVGTIYRYERRLGVTDGALRGPIDSMTRALDPRRLRVIAPERDREGRARQLNELDARIMTGLATGRTWTDAADLLTGDGGLSILDRTREEWLQALCSELLRSTRLEQAARLEALCRLAADPSHADAVERTIRDVAGQPGCPRKHNLLDVLGDSVAPGIVPRLVDDLETTGGAEHFGSYLALTCQLAYGEIDHAVRTRLQRLLDAMVCDSDGTRAALARSLRSRLDAPTPAGQASAAAVRESGPYVRAAFLESGMTDPVLQRLVLEALGHDHAERRHHAVVLLGASPYRKVVAQVALDALRSGSLSPLARPRTAYIVLETAGREATGTLLGLLHDGKREHRVLAASTLLSWKRPPDGLAPAVLAERSGSRDLAIDAAGMWGHESLSAFGLRDPRVQWWTSHGPAVDDAARLAATE